MHARLNGVWLFMLVLAGLLSLLYLWYIIFPGAVQEKAFKYFTMEQILHGRQYHRILRLVYILNFLIQGAFMFWLTFGGSGVTLFQWCWRVTGGNYWSGILLFSFTLWLLLNILSLPFSFFSSYYWQHRWGFSTQSLGGWWLDYAKGSAIELLLYTAGVALLFWAIGRFSKMWWLIGAALCSVWLVIQIVIWPVAISPLFNKFTPAREPGVIEMVQELAKKAGLPVEQVLVMDASRRTTQANAYFTGLGQTKRIVLYDTLLEKYSPDEIKAVVAHEMAHWRQGHIVKGLGWGMLGLFILWGGLYFVLLRTYSAGTLCYPHILPAVLLFFTLVSFAGSPVQNHLSRAMEKEADRIAVILTGDAGAAVRLQIGLAGKNLADVSPAPFIVWFGYSHPPTLSRIADIEAVD